MLPAEVCLVPAAQHRGASRSGGGRRQIRGRSAAGGPPQPRAAWRGDAERQLCCCRLIWPGNPGQCRACCRAWPHWTCRPRERRARAEARGPRHHYPHSQELVVGRPGPSRRLVSVHGCPVPEAPLAGWAVAARCGWALSTTPVHATEPLLCRSLRGWLFERAPLAAPERTAAQAGRWELVSAQGLAATSSRGLLPAVSRVSGSSCSSRSCSQSQCSARAERLLVRLWKHLLEMWCLGQSGPGKVQGKLRLRNGRRMLSLIGLRVELGVGATCRDRFAEVYFPPPRSTAKCFLC